MSEYFTKKSGGLSLRAVVARLDKTEREKLAEGYDLIKFAKVFADGDMMATLDCLFENSLNVSDTARKMYMHRNTLIYRLRKLKELTGLDACVFSDAVTFIILYSLYSIK